MKSRGAHPISPGEHSQPPRPKTPSRVICAGKWNLESPPFQVDGVEFQAVYRTGTEALDKVRLHNPELAVVDEALPDIGTLDWLRRVARAAPGVNTIVACEQLRPGNASLWLMAGAAGCVCKPLAPAELARVCRRALDLGIYFPPSILREVLRAVQRLRLAAKYGDSLTCRELDVLVGLCLGKCDKDIAAWLGLEFGTVKTHVHKLLVKFDVKHRNEIVQKLSNSLGLLPGTDHS